VLHEAVFTVFWIIFFWLGFRLYDKYIFMPFYQKYLVRKGLILDLEEKIKSLEQEKNRLVLDYKKLELDALKKAKHIEENYFREALDIRAAELEKVTQEVKKELIEKSRLLDKQLSELASQSRQKLDDFFKALRQKLNLSS